MAGVKRETFDSALKEGDGRSGNGLIYSTFAASINFLRPYAPQIVPVVVCAFFTPVIFASSGFAGFVVWNSLSAGWEVPLYLQYGDGVAPYAVSLIPSLHPSQRYDISLHLDVPASESNLALGNFMANLALSTISNKTLVAARRPAVAVTYPSWYPLWNTRVLSIDIPMFSAFAPGAPHLLADVQVGRADNWRTVGDGAGRELSVVSASVRGLVVPHGVRGLAIRFPLLSSLTAAFIFLVISTLFLGICILPLMLPNGLDEDVQNSSISTVPFPTERQRRKKRSHFRHTSETTNPSPESSVSSKSDLNPHPSLPNPES